MENAAVSYRSWVRGLLTDLAREAGVPVPASLARQLHLIYDGASLSARMDHDPSAAVAARAAAVLLDAALDPASRSAAAATPIAQPTPLEDAGPAIDLPADLSAVAGRLAGSTGKLTCDAASCVTGGCAPARGCRSPGGCGRPPVNGCGVSRSPHRGSGAS